MKGPLERVGFSFGFEPRVEHATVLARPGQGRGFGGAKPPTGTRSEDGFAEKHEVRYPAPKAKHKHFAKAECFCLV